MIGGHFAHYHPKRISRINIAQNCRIVTWHKILHCLMIIKQLPSARISRHGGKLGEKRLSPQHWITALPIASRQGDATVMVITIKMVLHQLFQQ
jgi:hypothetical protein